MKVGIFWFYQHHLIAKAMDTAELVADSLGLIDSPFLHVTEWETNQLFLPAFEALRASEYQEFPRGRVVYSPTKNRATVYMDRTLFSDANKQLIKAQFQLTHCKISWKADPHYRVFSAMNCL